MRAASRADGLRSAPTELGELTMALHTRDACNQDAERIRQLVFSTLAEYGLEPDPSTTDADLADIERHYQRSGGAFLVLVDDDDRVVGSAGLYPLSATECELRKMYLDPGYRSQGWGGRLLEQMIREARARGFCRIQLETASVLKAAIALYQRYGFAPIQAQHLARRCDQAWALDL
jgi:putative acetyltransferase